MGWSGTRARSFIHPIRVGAWEPQASGTEETLNSVFGSNDAGARIGPLEIRHDLALLCEGRTWRLQTSGTEDFLSQYTAALTAVSSGAVGANGHDPTLVESGPELARETNEDRANLSSVFCSRDGGEVWAVGSQAPCCILGPGPDWQQLGEVKTLFPFSYCDGAEAMGGRKKRQTFCEQKPPLPIPLSARLD